MSEQLTAPAGAKAACVRSLEIMADGDLTHFAALIHPQAVNREAAGPRASRGPGPAAFHATALWLRGAFSGLRWEVTRWPQNQTSSSSTAHGPAVTSVHS